MYKIQEIIKPTQYKIQKIIKPTLYKIQEIIRNIKRKKRQELITLMLIESIGNPALLFS